MNTLLEVREMPLLSMAQYKSIFGFPVKGYYEALGFDFDTEPWAEVAAEYMFQYHALESTFELYDEVEQLLAYFQLKRKKQYILSAMKTESILTMLTRFKLKHHFDGVYGMDNHYAHGKLSVGQLLIKEAELKPQDCLLIGDTIHDAEVARALGVDCCLLASGHQDMARLKHTGREVFSSLKELMIALQG